MVATFCLRCKNELHQSISPDWFSQGNVANLVFLRSPPGLPDFSLHNIPKWAKIYRITSKLLNEHENIPNGRKM
jgi:hypothetical protein